MLLQLQLSHGAAVAIINAVVSASVVAVFKILQIHW